MALQNRPAMWGRSIVSNCYGDGGCITTEHAERDRLDPKRIGRVEVDRDPLAFEGVCSDPADPTVADWLLRGGVRRVVVGHKPTGDCPAVLSAARTGVEIVSADTSYSDSSAGDNRGAAIAVVEIAGAGERDNRLIISGRLKDGTDHYSTFNRLHDGGIDCTVGDAILGTCLEGGWWVKAVTPPYYRLCRGRGRKVEFMTVHIADLPTFSNSPISQPS